MIVSPARVALTAETTPTDDKETTYAEKRLNFTAQFEGAKQKREAEQRAKKTKATKHEVKADWAKGKRKDVASLMRSTLSKKKKFWKHFF